MSQFNTRALLPSCLGALSAALCGALVAQPSQAAGVLLDFEGIGNSVSIDNFYNGGAAGNGVIGPNYGVTFTSSALALIDSDSGGSGNFANEPSPDSVMIWLNDLDTHMNYAPGFTQFSAFYSAAVFPGNLSFWSGFDGTGTQVGTTLDLPLLGTNCGGDPNGFNNCWKKVAAVLPDHAHSVTFGGSSNYIGFDNVSFNPQDIEVPTPLPMFGAAAAFGSIRRLRKLSSQLNAHSVESEIL